MANLESHSYQICYCNYATHQYECHGKKIALFVCSGYYFLDCVSLVYDYTLLICVATHICCFCVSSTYCALSVPAVCYSKLYLKKIGS